jgi:hypothetical protein
MAAFMGREPVGRVSMYWGGVIEDRGKLRYAVPGAGGKYIFSERGVGVYPLVLIGTSEEVLNFIGTRISYWIENQIPSLPGIYMGISKYVPGSRFKGHFPVGDAIEELVKGVTAIGGAALGGIPSKMSSSVRIGAIVADLGGALKDFADNVKTVLFTGQKYSSSERSKPLKATGLLYIKFHYLQDRGMTLIGKKKVTFQILQFILEKALGYA